MRKSLVKILCLLLTAVLISSCSKPSQVSSDNAKKDDKSSSKTSSVTITITPAALDLPIGRTIALKANSNSNKAISWSSTNESVASVSKEGKVTSHALGEAFIEANIDDVSAKVRVSVIEGNVALAYDKDPGPIPEPGSDRVPPSEEGNDEGEDNNEDGNEDTNDDKNNEGEDNIPIIVPENQENVPKDEAYVWTIVIDDGFEAELKMSEMPGYLVRNDVKLFAQKVEGDSIYGQYKGTLELEAKINEQSFINAMNSIAPDSPITAFKSNTNIQTAEITFTIVPYEADTFREKNAEFMSDNALPMIEPLVPPSGMAIATYTATATQTTSITAEEGYGGASGGGTGTDLPFQIKVNHTGDATLYLPRMLMAYQYNTFVGKVYKSPKQ